MIGAVIPTRYRPPQLARLLSVLADDDVPAYVMDSNIFGHRIYAMWNAGVECARRDGATHVAILNDDIEIMPGTLAALAAALDADPTIGVTYPDVDAPWGPVPTKTTTERTTGTWGAGGMTGFCFMFRTRLTIRFDERWNLWYGDDEFERSVRASGLVVARVRGVPIAHLPMGSTGRDMAYWGPLIEEDRLRWDTLA